MIKAYKKHIILSSIVILLPVLAGLILWDRLPATMTTHWGADGSVDGWSSKAFAVFGFPVILLAMHWLMILLDTRFTKNYEQNRKAYRIVFWIIPLLSLTANGFIYAFALGWEFQPEVLISLSIGLMFILIGNYLPKVRQNPTLGIKISWTLTNEENWNRTHRLAGKMWVIGGVLLLFTVFLPMNIAMRVWMPVILILTLVPIGYSYYLHRTLPHTNEGTAEVPVFNKNANRVGIVLIPLILIGCAVLMFTGDVNVQFGETSFTIEATYWDDLTVDYAGIDSVEYREDGVAGARVGGYGSPRLSLGNFRNDEFGDYTRFTYTQQKSCVVLTSAGRILVLNGADDAATQAIYDELSARCGE
ncbi:MAG: SdpI family protein [Clostridia bacterium]|nr:SdpI family protein [Clostridia bacterium]